MRRALLACLALAALVVALAGCGGGGGGEDAERAAPPQERIAAAARTTAEAGSSRIAFTATVTAPSQGGRERRELSGEGEFDYEARKGRLVYDIGGLLEGAGEGGTQAEVVFDTTVLYMRFPVLAGSLPAGKEWVRIDLEKLGQAQGIDLAELSQLSQDPSQLLDYLRATSSEIEELGAEDVRGDATTHYRARVDLDKVPDQAPEDARPVVRQSVEALKRQLGRSTLPVDVWIDEEGRVRRFRQDLSAEGSDVEVTMELYDFGTDVDAEAPPAEETVDLAELLGGGGG